MQYTLAKPNSLLPSSYFLSRLLQFITTLNLPSLFFIFPRSNLSNTSNITSLITDEQQNNSKMVHQPLSFNSCDLDDVLFSALNLSVISPPKNAPASYSSSFHHGLEGDAEKLTIAAELTMHFFNGHASSFLRPKK